MSRFMSKTHGRIFVADESKIPAVRAKIKELDDFEYTYLPDNFVTKWNGKIETTYGHKFEIDMEQLTEACWNEGIWIFCVTGYRDPLAYL